MNWQQQLQPASFKGVSFGVVTTETIVGRRVVVHEYPFSDTPFSEDMGQRAQEYIVKAFCIGDQYIGNMQALLAACQDDDSVGTLVLPTIGAVSVICKECRTVFSNNEGGIEYLSLTFVEAGNQQFPSGLLNTIFAVAQAVLGSSLTFGNVFSSLYSVNNLPGFVGNASLFNLIGSPTPLGGSIIQPSQSFTGIMSNVVQNGANQNVG